MKVSSFFIILKNLIKFGKSIADLFVLQPCVESLFLAFLSDNRIREILLPIVVNTIENNYASPDPNDMNAILRKDAVYNVFGLSVFFLFNDEVNALSLYRKNYIFKCSLIGILFADLLR